MYGHKQGRDAYQKRMKRRRDKMTQRTGVVPTEAEVLQDYIDSQDYKATKATKSVAVR